jgi:ABC-type polysaccharide/polyol phosphate export permease
VVSARSTRLRPDRLERRLTRRASGILGRGATSGHEREGTLETTVPAGGESTGDTLVLRPGWTAPSALARELRRSTQLCVTLARKDFFVRYRRATLGMLWAVALPALQAVVLAVVLSRVARIKVPHYTVFILSGIVGWTYFTATLASGATAIVDNTSLSSRIYFPRAVLPIAVSLSNLYALAISLLITVVVAVATGVPFGVDVAYLVPATLLMFLLTTSAALVLSALHVYFRDVRYAVQAFVLVWFYVTPVFYPLDRLHGTARRAVEANPVSGCVELFHAAVLGITPSMTAVLYTVAWTVLLLVLATLLHCRFDRTFADLL